MFGLFCLCFGAATAVALWIANPARPSRAGYWGDVRRYNRNREYLRNHGVTTITRKLGV